MKHVHPGTDTTVNPVIINDTHRERQHSSEHKQPKERESEKRKGTLADLKIKSCWGKFGKVKK